MSQKSSSVQAAKSVSQALTGDNRTPYERFHLGHLHNFTYETLAMLALRAGFIQSEETPERSTALIFYKTEPTEEWQLFPDHYKEMREFFDTYTNRRYFLTPTPYFRGVHRMKRLSGDMVKASVMRNQPSRAGKSHYHEGRDKPSRTRAECAEPFQRSQYLA